MTPFMNKLLSLEANADIFDAVHTRFAECARDTPRHDDDTHNIMAASEEILADIATIVLFNRCLTLTSHPMEREIDVAYRGVFRKSGLEAIGSEPRQVAEYVSSKVMGRLKQQAKAA